MGWDGRAFATADPGSNKSIQNETPSILEISFDIGLVMRPGVFQVIHLLLSWIGKLYQ